ncbi:MAG: M23 family metallopeptidase [Dysgonamonadaceae bacterium]|jgi:lipoprotein NlpD|nr:M23 family metallopeptidase [Dysgonamonadaceae bacterium]
MAKKRKKTNFWKRIGFKYKLSVLNENTLENLFSFRISGLFAFLVVAFFAGLLISLTAIVIINTPIRNYLPGYLDSEIRKDIVDNALKADSLEYALEKQNRYLENISSIFRGDTVVPSVFLTDTLYTSGKGLERSKREEEFLANYEEQEKYNLSSLPASNTLPDNIIFYRPVRGVISSKFDPKERHFGIDIAAAPKESVLATLGGTVVFTGFDANAGYVIQLQHKNGLVSIYKHNALLLKKEGEEVVAGEAIALVGNTGKLSSGTHLHFEIWFNGFPINPETVIVF